MIGLPLRTAPEIGSTGWDAMALFYVKSAANVHPVPWKRFFPLFLSVRTLDDGRKFPPAKVVFWQHGPRACCSATPAVPHREAENHGSCGIGFPRHEVC